jgi:hypothetical protein
MSETEENNDSFDDAISAEPVQITIILALQAQVNTIYLTEIAHLCNV